MKYLRLADNTRQILPFYLAMEEFAAHYLNEDEIFFMWQPKPSVIFGRNQLIDNEVNIAYCHEHGIGVFRRKSGGGCVFADEQNIMFSYITASSDVKTTFEHYTSAIVEMLKGLGLDAVFNSRNDILVNGLKVSGNAFYRTAGHSIVHGTMLFGTNLEHMSQAITPSKAKLNAKGVNSVRSRITTLSEHLDIDIEEFKSYVVSTLCNGEIMLNNDNIAKIEQITQTYLTPDFIYGKNPHCDIVKRGRIERVGEFEISIELYHNRIKNVNIAGDYFLIGDLDNAVLAKLQGVALERSELEHALEAVNVSDIIMNLTNNQLINLFLE